MTVLSCIGHWYAQLLFAVPFVGIAGFIGWDRFRQSRREMRAPRGRTDARGPGMTSAS